MRKAILAAVAALAIGGATTGILIANAQPAPPPPGTDGPPRPQWMGWMHRGPEWAAKGREMRRNFALVYRAEDRQLTPSDVQKIAEAFLLWNGNHTWKVVNVAPTPDGAIGFTLATADGGVIARFSMDPHTARLTRTG
jgi:hypothetical protein